MAAESIAMEDVIAVEVQCADGSSRYFLTWGRIQDSVDPGPVCQLVLQAAHQFSLPAEPGSARLCDSLREPAAAEAAPYFYECFLKFAHESIPFGEEYARWKSEKATAMAGGQEIAYCGSP